MNQTSTDYEIGLREALLDANEATAYLNAALEDEDQEVFLLALHDIAEAHGLSRVAQEAFLNRENLYRMLPSAGNPQPSSLKALLKSWGLRLAVDVATV